MFISNMPYFNLFYWKKGLKIFENKGIKIDEKDPNICIPIELKKEIEILFDDCFCKTDPEYNKYLFKVC